MFKFALFAALLSGPSANAAQSVSTTVNPDCSVTFAYSFSSDETDRFFIYGGNIADDDGYTVSDESGTCPGMATRTTDTRLLAEIDPSMFDLSTLDFDEATDSYSYNQTQLRQQPRP